MATSAGPRELVVEIPMEEGDPLGAVPNDKMVIVRIQAGTISEGKLEIGDQVLKVNNIKIRDGNHFYELLRFAPPVAALTIRRDGAKAAEVQNQVHIPPERERNVTRRDGYEYLLTSLEWKANGPKLGLSIKHYQNRVLVSRTEAGTLSALALKTLDHIVDVEGHPVTDKDVCRDLIIRCLKGAQKCSLLIERPTTMETKQWAQRALEASSMANQPPSVQMNSDVRNILQRERAKLMANANKPPPKGILVGACRHPNPVTINEEVKKDIIASDNEGKALRPVKK